MGFVEKISDNPILLLASLCEHLKSVITENTIERSLISLRFVELTLATATNMSSFCFLGCF